MEVVERAIKVAAKQWRMLQAVTDTVQKPLYLANEIIMRPIAAAAILQQHVLNQYDHAEYGLDKAVAQWRMLQPIIKIQDALRLMQKSVAVRIAADTIAQQRTLQSVWHSVGRIADDFFEFQELCKYMPFYKALRSLQEGDVENVNFFLLLYCGIKKPTLEAHGLLWEVWKEGRWRKADNPISYVKTAFRRQYKQSLFDDKLLIEDRRLIPLDTVTGEFVTPQDNYQNGKEKLWTPQNDIKSAEERIFIEQILNYLPPQDRQAWRAYCLGDAETIRDAFGSKNAQDAARRRLRKIAEKLEPFLFK